MAPGNMPSMRRFYRLSRATGIALCQLWHLPQCRGWGEDVTKAHYAALQLFSAAEWRLGAVAAERN